MNFVNLPTERATEPLEDARQSQMPLEQRQEIISKKHTISFTNNTKTLSHGQTNKAYKEVLSQPPKEISHKQKLIWLQKRRSTGLWVQCDDCDRWRYLKNILDSYELPNKWNCKLNPDSEFACCAIPEVPIQVREEEDLIHSKYSAGSVVWARIPGWPWWPAMVDDCPDTEQFYWLDGFSDIPTHFNVVFFDIDVTRAWMSLNQLRHYSTYKEVKKNSIKHNKYSKRLQTAVAQANDAVALPLCARLDKYSFIARFEGYISTPKKISRFFQRKYQNQLRRKFNIDFPIESSSDSDDDNVKRIIEKKNKQTPVRKQTKNKLKCSKKEIKNTSELKLLDCHREIKCQKENSLTLIELAPSFNSMAVEVGIETSMIIDGGLSSNIGTDINNVTSMPQSSTQEIEELDSSDLKRTSSPSFEFD